MPTRASPSEDFEIGGVSLARGTRGKVSLEAARLPTGTPMSVGVHVLHGRQPGPTVFVSGAVHGDELSGVAAVVALAQRLDPMALRGTILAVPMVNAYGVLHRSRYLPDRRDLNRSFPGSSRGSLTARLAHLFLEKVVARCEIGIDLHAGASARRNLVQIRADLEDARTRELAIAFGAPICMHARMRPGSLRSEAAQRDIRVLLCEAGEALRIDRVDVESVVHGVERVLHKLGMISEPPPPPPTPTRVVRSVGWLRATRSGLCEMHVSLGQVVAVGDLIATVVDPDAGTLAPVLARRAGIVVGMQHSGIVYRGDALVHLALVGETAPEIGSTADSDDS